MLDSFDIPYALRQTAVVAAIVVFPFAVYAAIVHRRTVWSRVCVGSLVVWMMLIAVVLWSSARVWSGSDIPFRPLPIGPSYLSLFDIAKVVVVTIWAPAAVIFTVNLWVRGSRPVIHVAGRWVLFFMVVGGSWTAFFMTVFEHAHENTIYSPDFSLLKWDQVRAGMTRDEVVRLLGPPLPEHLQPWFARNDGSLCWVRNWSAGYFAAIWFDQGKVTRTNLWYSD